MSQTKYDRPWVIATTFSEMKNHHVPRVAACSGPPRAGRRRTVDVLQHARVEVVVLAEELGAHGVAAHRLAPRVTMSSERPALGS